MSGIITPGQSKLVLHNRSEPYELTYNIAKRWGNNKSRIVLISESGSNEQAVPQISQTFHFLNVIPRGGLIWKAFAQELLLLSQLRVQSATLEEKVGRYIHTHTHFIHTYTSYVCAQAYKASRGLPPQQGDWLGFIAVQMLTLCDARNSLAERTDRFIPLPVPCCM